MRALSGDFSQLLDADKSLAALGRRRTALHILNRIQRAVDKD